MPSARNVVGVAGAQEAVLALAARRGLRARGRRARLDPARDRLAGRDQRDAAAEHALEHRAHERVVRAAEDHRVDARLAQRLAVAAHGVDDLLVEREAGLDDRRELRARRPRSASTCGSAARERALVGADRDRRRRGEQPDAAVARRRHRRSAPGWTTPITSMPSVVCHSARAARAAPRRSPSCRRPRAASTGARAAPRRSGARSPELRRPSASPYGNRAVSPRYRKSSWGSATSSSCSTVSPPTPESNTPIGRRRAPRAQRGGGHGRAVSQRPAARAAPALSPPADAVDRRP